MKILAFIWALILLSNCDFISRTIAKYKNIPKSWETVAFEESIFRGWSEEEIKSLLGTTDYFINSHNSHFN